MVLSDTYPNLSFSIASDGEFWPKKYDRPHGSAVRARSARSENYGPKTAKVMPLCETLSCESGPAAGLTLICESERLLRILEGPEVTIVGAEGTRCSSTLPT